LPTYTLRRFSRPAQGWYGPTDDVRDVEAVDDQQAVLIAQAVAAEPENDLLAIELRDAGERMIWSLMRGETVSKRPGEVP
jgi:hypothetical protein